MPMAETVEAENIEKLVAPVKDLFGAIFFVSVGMMVEMCIRDSGNSCRIARQPDTLLVVYIYIIDNVPVHFVVTTIICNDIRLSLIHI